MNERGRDRERRWFGRFVMLTGAANLLGGPIIVMIAGSPMMAALASRQAVWVLAGFLSFSGAALIWAAAAPRARAPVIFWEGVLRLWAALTFMLMPGWPNSVLVVSGDGLIGIAYIAGLAIVGVSWRAALFGEPDHRLPDAGSIGW